MNAEPSYAVVHVVDDDESFRQALTRLLRTAGYEVRPYASAGAFLLERQAGARGCLVLDMKMPGPSGLELQEALLRQNEMLPIIFLTGYGDIPRAVQALKAGAVDFLTKPVQRTALLAAVQTALTRDVARRATRDRVRESHTRLDSLTPREREVLAHVTEGKPNKWIAAELGTAERTVKAHRAQIMRKMGVSSVAELVHVTDELRFEEHRN